jgi:hypothetical protein
MYSSTSRHFAVIRFSFDKGVGSYGKENMKIFFMHGHPD